jgi:hypothetical protein
MSLFPTRLETPVAVMAILTAVSGNLSDSESKGEMNEKPYKYRVI